MARSLHVYTQLGIALLLTALSICNANAADDKTYTVGEKLQTENTIKAPQNATYQPLEWDALYPANWDPLAAFKDLDLDNLDDADPKATEALAAMGEAWKNAPIIPALNGQRVRISGFVVPLDISKHKVKTFLLVPYFGACIHVPPPPSNQVIHAVNAQVSNKQQNKTLKSAAQIQGPITINGILETVPSDTAMGSAGYKMQIESIEAYEAAVN